MAFIFREFSKRNQDDRSNIIEGGSLVRPHKEKRRSNDRYESAIAATVSIVISKVGANLSFVPIVLLRSTITFYIGIYGYEEHGHREAHVYSAEYSSMAKHF